MFSNDPLLLHLRVALLAVVHFAADTEERLSRGARRLRWSLRDRIDEAASALAPVSSSALLRGSLRTVLSICVQALTLVLSLIPAKLHRRRRREATAKTILSTTKMRKTMASSSPESTSKNQQPRGRPPSRPATEAAVIFAEFDEAELPLGRVADVVEWCSQSGLERLFVFDPAGHVKRRAAELSEELSRRRRRRAGGARAMAAVLQQSWAGPLFAPSPSPLSSPSSPSSSSSSFSSPAPAPPILHVHLISGEDAEAPLLAAAAAVAGNKERVSKKVEAASTAEGDGGGGRSAASAVSSSSTSSRSSPEEGQDDRPSSSFSDLDAALVATPFGEPATAKPQVCLCYGGHFTLSGFPAWGLAQSEVYQMGPLAEATRRGVSEAAERFLSTSQRFGR